MFGNHGLCGLLEEGAHGKSPKCLDGNLGDFGEFCKGLYPLCCQRRPHATKHLAGAATHAVGGNSGRSSIYGVFCFLAPLQETGRKYSSMVPLQDHTVLPLGLVPVPDTAKLGIR